MMPKLNAYLVFNGNCADAMIVRAGEQAEMDHSQTIWYDGWQDAHAAIVR